MSALDFAMNNLFKIGQSKNMSNSNPFARNPTIIVYLIRFAPEIKKVCICLDQSLGKNLHVVERAKEKSLDMDRILDVIAFTLLRGTLYSQKIIGFLNGSAFRYGNLFTSKN